VSAFPLLHRRSALENIPTTAESGSPPPSAAIENMMRQLQKFFGKLQSTITGKRTEPSPEIMESGTMPSNEELSTAASNALEIMREHNEDLKPIIVAAAMQAVATHIKQMNNAAEMKGENVHYFEGVARIATVNTAQAILTKLAAEKHDMKEVQALTVQRMAYYTAPGAIESALRMSKDS
jgi:hypothetical protein